ncbi:MAG TPA: class I SAM-dependent methyltransferase [Mycobacteriales bacterium]|nr:class I SAM-dependent methyltransferase [Mycobacteriales bacterium]
MPTDRPTADVLKRWPALYRAGRWAWVRSRRQLPPYRLEGIPGPVHRNDLMLGGTDPDAITHYRRVGEEAVELIGESLATAGRSWADVDGALDFAAGYGRVTRHLVTKVAPGDVTVTDIDADAVRFCVRAFGVVGAGSDPSFRRGSLRSYDVAWSGSLATHLPAEAWRAWLHLMAEVIRPGGVLVFTTHDVERLGHLAEYDPAAPAEEARLRAEIAATGHAYMRYPHHKGEYGLAFQTPERTATDAAEHGFAVLSHRTRGWDGHQDVVVCQRQG